MRITAKKSSMAVVALSLLMLLGWQWLDHSSPIKPSSAQAQPRPVQSDSAADEPDLRGDVIRVDAVHPGAGGLPRITTQPGSVHAFDYADLFAKVSGYLVDQTVDIGDQVKAGQVLVRLDSPELRKEVDRESAAVERAKAQVQQMLARVSSAIAEHKAAEAAVEQARADIQRDEAKLAFHDKQYKRISELFELKSIDEKLVDEKEDQFRAAQAAVAASKAALVTQQAQVVASAAKIEQAKADVVDAKAFVKVCDAALAKAQVFVDYLTITAPYDGVVTYRGFHRGDFIKAADQGATEKILSVARVDLMRVIMPIPDRDVPYANPGDKAYFEVDALPGRRFEGKISRIAVIEDDKTRNMRAEIDLSNQEQLLRGGMYGRATVELQPAAPGAVHVPSTCLVGASRDGTATVYVVRNGKAQSTVVRIGTDNGIDVEVLQGLTVDDLVVSSNSGAVQNGTPVDANVVESDQGKKLATH